MTNIAKKRPPWTKHVYRDPSLPALTAGVAIPLAVLVLMLRPANGVVWFCAGLALGTPPLVLLARRRPGASTRPHVGKAITRYALTLDEAERRILAHLAASGGTAGLTPEHESVPHAPHRDRVLGLALDGYAFLAELAWWRGRLVACVGPAPEPLTPGYDRFMQGLDLVLAAPPQRGYPTLPPLGEGTEAPGAVTIERRHRNYRRRVPRLLAWTLGLLYCLTLTGMGVMVVLANSDHVNIPFMALFVAAMGLAMTYIALRLSDEVEALVRAWARLEGPRVTYGWTGGRARELVLDENALVVVDVADGPLERATSPGSITGYRFEGGGRRIKVNEDLGFDHDDLVRMWPAVLDAARRHGTMVGPEMGRIVAGEERATASSASRDRPQGRAP